MKGSPSEIILAGDIGGTKTRLGLFLKGSYRPVLDNTFPSKDYKNLETLIKDFLKERRKIVAACLGVPGPVIKETTKTTNLPWSIRKKSLQRALGLRKVEVINDLVANAYGISVLRKKDFVILNRGKPAKGNAALLSAGTGLGEAILFWNGKDHVPSASEGGHVEFGPRNDLEMKLLQYLSGRFVHVSYERILSGAGLLHIYQFLRDSRRYGKEPEWLSKRFQQEDPAAVISEMARSKKSRLCVMALNLFTSIYGAATGNLALQVMAIGGIYIGGGIAPKIIWKLKEGTFMEAFKDKGRFSEMVANIPIKVIMNDRTALLGAARLAMELLGQG
ncbi:MAG: glucokinase [Thermodesulfobacteriota bacterium]|nr:glucokinase [Thermodesulfobacteriota bacterium]